MQKTLKFENFENALYLTSGSMPLSCYRQNISFSQIAQFHMLTKIIIFIKYNWKEMD